MTIEQRLIVAGLAENDFAAKGMMKKRNLEATLPPFEWARIYRGHRDTGKTSDEAAALANKGETPK